MRPLAPIATLAIALAAPAAAGAHLGVTHTGVAERHAAPPRPASDVVDAQVTVSGRTAEFAMTVRGRVGSRRPAPTGRLAGSRVESYVWPTTLDPSAVGFPRGSGILAMAVTSHPDFDDTPLFDEDGNGRRDDDGRRWHSHWVVLGADPTCGGGLKVVDIAEGERPALPATWPGLPILIDSPGWQPVLSRRSVSVKVAFADPAVLAGTRFDAVTAALRVNADLHAPLLCVTQAHDVLSGDLSLPQQVKVG